VRLEWREHHLAIDCVTPEQWHRGLREANVARRKEQFHQQWHMRKEVNRLHHNALTDNQEKAIVNANQFTACSVMDL